MDSCDQNTTQFKQSPQVIVVGASLGGLQAAYELQQRGVSCIVLEARNEIGGRFHYGLGATQYPRVWADPAQHPRAWNLVQDLGLEMTRETLGKSIMRGFGAYDHDDIPFSDEADHRSYTHVLESIEIFCQRLDFTHPTHMATELSDDSSITFRDLLIDLGATPNIQKLADTWTATIFGLTACDVTALDFLRICKTAGGFLNAIGRLGEGISPMRIKRPQSLREALAQRLNAGSVLLSQSVCHIDQRLSSKCMLTTTTEDTFECSRVIVAAPASSFRHIDLSPELEAHGQRTQVYEPSGFCIRTVLVYDQPWWRTKGLSGSSQSTEGPIWETQDTSNDEEGVYALTCIAAGESGRELWNKDLLERRDTILAHVRDIFSMFTAIPDPILRIEPRDIAYTRQALCIAGLGAFVGAGGWEVKGRIHFTGHEANSTGKSHLEGALASGSKAAGEVYAAMMPAEELILAKL